jgi:transcriptional regulator with XRE-family HTH domain
MTIEELKKWRERNGISQAALGELLQVHSVSVARWETGVHPIPAFLEMALAELERRLTAEPRPKKTSKRKEVAKDGSKNPRKKTG